MKLSASQLKINKTYSVKGEPVKVYRIDQLGFNKYLVRVSFEDKTVGRWCIGIEKIFEI